VRAKNVNNKINIQFNLPPYGNVDSKCLTPATAQHILLFVIHTAYNYTAGRVST